MCCRAIQNSIWPNSVTKLMLKRQKLIKIQSHEEQGSEKDRLKETKTGGVSTITFGSSRSGSVSSSSAR